jgi:hypothetical protein
VQLPCASTTTTALGSRSSPANAGRALRDRGDRGDPAEAVVRTGRGDVVGVRAGRLAIAAIP